jgi:NAD(P)-dependent dehydrogenase (short-subunit alcohol dehydrogenase family)
MRDGTVHSPSGRAPHRVRGPKMARISVLRLRTPVTETCRCGTRIAPGSSVLRLVTTEADVASMFRGRVFCSERCIRAFILESLETLASIDTAASNAVVTDLHELFRELAETLSAVAGEEFDRQADPGSPPGGRQVRAAGDRFDPKKSEDGVGRSSEAGSGLDRHDLGLLDTDRVRQRPAGTHAFASHSHEAPPREPSVKMTAVSRSPASSELAWVASVKGTFPGRIPVDAEDGPRPQVPAA